MTEDMEMKSSGGGNKNILIVILAVVVVALIGAGIYFMRGDSSDNGGGGGRGRKGTTLVGSIDRDKVLEAAGFEEASKKIEALTKASVEDFKKATANLDDRKKEDQAKKAAIYNQINEKMKVETNKIITPLYKKAETAVSVVALNKKMHTVLDKKIVVCGAVDITDEVVAKLKSGENLTMPAEADIKALTDKSTIGYFDKMVMISMPDFAKAEQQIAAKGAQLQVEFEAEVKKLRSEEDKQKLQMIYAQKLMEIRNELYAPLYRQVNRAVERVAETEQMDLVVDKENVMYGGRNLTDEIAAKLVDSKEENAGTAEKKGDK